MTKSGRQCVILGAVAQSAPRKPTRSQDQAVSGIGLSVRSRQHIFLLSIYSVRDIGVQNQPDTLLFHPLSQYTQHTGRLLNCRIYPPFRIRIQRQAPSFKLPHHVFRRAYRQHISGKGPVSEIHRFSPVCQVAPSIACSEQFFPRLRPSLQEGNVGSLFRGSQRRGHPRRAPAHDQHTFSHLCLCSPVRLSVLSIAFTIRSCRLYAIRLKKAIVFCTSTE